MQPLKRTWVRQIRQIGGQLDGVIETTREAKEEVKRYKKGGSSLGLFQSSSGSRDGSGKMAAQRAERSEGNLNAARLQSSERIGKGGDGGGSERERRELIGAGAEAAAGAQFAQIRANDEEIEVWRSTDHTYFTFPLFPSPHTAARCGVTMLMILLTGRWQDNLDEIAGLVHGLSGQAESLRQGLATQEVALHDVTEQTVAATESLDAVNISLAKSTQSKQSEGCCCCCCQ